MKTILESIQDAGSDDHTVFGGTFTGGYFLQQEPDEFSELIEVLLVNRLRLKSYLAVGIAAGGAERFITKAIDTIDRLTIIDDGRHPNHVRWGENKKALTDLGVEVKQYIGDSHGDGAKDFLKSDGSFYDLASIDGDHNGEGPIQDFNLILPYMSKGGLVWFHDVNGYYTSVPQIFRKLSKDYKVVLHTNGRCGIGVLRV